MAQRRAAAHAVRPVRHAGPLSRAGGENRTLQANDLIFRGLPNFSSETATGLRLTRRLMGAEESLRRYRYRTSVLTGPWRDTEFEAANDAVRAKQAVERSHPDFGHHAGPCRAGSRSGSPGKRRSRRDEPGRRPAPPACAQRSIQRRWAWRRSLSSALIAAMKAFALCRPRPSISSPARPRARRRSTRAAPRTGSGRRGGTRRSSRRDRDRRRRHDARRGRAGPRPRSCSGCPRSSRCSTSNRYWLRKGRLGEACMMLIETDMSSAGSWSCTSRCAR